MNAVILTSVLSAGNSGMYASTRMLYSMSKDKLAFEAFGKTNKNGVPYVVTCYSNHCSDYFRITKPYKRCIRIYRCSKWFNWFYCLVGIAVSHYRFRRAFDKQNYDKSKLKYTAKLFPFGPLFAGFYVL